MGKNISVNVFVISDATGQTAQSVIKAVLVQFPEIKPRLHGFPNVRTEERLLEIMGKAKSENAIVIYSLVSSELRRLVRNEGKRLDLILFDILGPLIGRVHRLFNVIPTSTPGLLAHVHHESILLAEAIDFTLKHDDGLGMDTISEADLIILGISRTSKTPSSIHLACNHLLKVPNIPIIPRQELPSVVSQLDTPKVGFTIDPERLAVIRKSRMRSLTLLPEYTDLKAIYSEVEHSESLFRRLKLSQTINVTDLSIEEISSRIIENTSCEV